MADQFDTVVADWPTNHAATDVCKNYLLILHPIVTHRKMAVLGEALHLLANAIMDPEIEHVAAVLNTRALGRPARAAYAPSLVDLHQRRNPMRPSGDPDIEGDVGPDIRLISRAVLRVGSASARAVSSQPGGKVI